VTRIKICGFTRRDDALGAAEWGADALGFIFAERSKRRADPEEVAKIAAEIPPFVTLVGVFQDQPISYVREVMNGCGLHVAQLHGLEDRNYLAELGFPVLKAVGLESESDLEQLTRYPEQSAFLIDAAKGGQTGGTGTTFNWSWALRAMKYGRIVLAGGLTPENVAEAIARVHPWGVDTAGGVESAPGIKDSAKVQTFIQRVRETDRALARHAPPHA
jgi:phosphoribosylanthranilate isomerase